MLYEIEKFTEKFVYYVTPYLMASFISLSFNITDWHIITRIVLAFAIFTCLVKDLNKKEEDSREYLKIKKIK